MSDAAALDAIEREYQDHFARRPRVTRSIERLDGLIGRVAALLHGTDAATAKETKERYENERRLISELQAGGQVARNTHRANALSNLVQRRYARHYAGKARRSRDQAQLREAAERLQVYLGEMNTLAQAFDHAVFAEARKRHAELLTSIQEELTAIPADFASAQGADRATALATRANAQFRTYRLNFANKERGTRRVSLIERIVRELTDVENEMFALQRTGYDDAGHAKNITIVTDSLKIYKNELAAVRSARMNTTDATVYTALAAEANALFERYRAEFAGRDRKTLNPEPLAEIADSLFEIALHMDETDRTRGGNYEANLFIVLENAWVYEDEITRIEAAKTAS